jgi:hypothetical protein
LRLWIPREQAPGDRSRSSGPAAIAGALDSEVSPAQRAKHALAVIEAVDPPVEVSVSGQIPTSAADVDRMSLTELRALLEQHSPPALES